MAISNVDKDLELKKRELSVDYWKLDLEDFRSFSFNRTNLGIEI